MSNQVLQNLQAKTISTKEAYQELYVSKKQTFFRRAHFVRLKIQVPDDKTANRLMRFLFLLPVPLLLVKIALKFVKDKGDESLPLTKAQIYDLISYKGIKVEINSQSGEKIYIKTF